MSETVTFSNMQVPVADVVAAAERIKAEREKPKPKPKPVEPGMYRWRDQTDADPFAGGTYFIRRKNADGSWDYATSIGVWQKDDAGRDPYVRDGCLVPLRPVEGVEYTRGTRASYRWHNHQWQFWMDDGKGWLASRDAPRFWRTGQLRPVAKAEPTPWTPKEGEWVQHKTTPWKKAQKVVSVVLDWARVGLGEEAERYRFDNLRKATPDEESAAKRIDLVDGLIVRGKGTGRVVMSDRFSNEELARAVLNSELLVVAANRLRETCATCRHWNDGKGQQAGPSWRNGVGCEAGIKGRFMSTTERLSGVIGPVKIYPPEDGSGYCWQWERKA